MKKILSVILTFLLLSVCIVGCGKKEQSDSAATEISLEPLKEAKLTSPTEVAAEGSENSVGLMAFYPNNNENMYALAGTNTFTVYFESRDVKVGTGKIGIYDKATNVLYTSRDAGDRQSIEIGTMDEIGTALTGWTSGTKIDIYFDKVFVPDTSYYVLIDGGFFTLGTVLSGAVTNASLITFGTKPYGVDATRINFNNTYSVGDSVALDILCDGQQATMFALKEYDTAFLNVAPVNGTESTTSLIHFLQGGTPSITVAFYNSGHEVDSVSFTFNVTGGSENDTDIAADGS